MKPKPHTLLCTVGTSLLGHAKNPEAPEQLKQALTNRRKQAILDQLRLLECSDRFCGAEINTVTELLNSDRYVLQKIVFLVSDTAEGTLSGQILKEYFSERRNFSGTAVEYDVVSGLQDGDPKRFKTKGLPNLVRKIGDHIQTAGGPEFVAIDATGGYKAQIAIAVLIGQALDLPVFYKHERFDAIIDFPPMPISLDFSVLAENAHLLVALEREGTLTSDEISGLDPKLRVFLNEEPCDDKVLYELNAVGQIYLTAFRQRVPRRVKLDPAESRKVPTFGNDHHYPAGFKNFVNKIWNLNPWIETMHTIPFDPSAKKIGFAVKPFNGERALIGWFEHACFRVIIPDKSLDSLALAADTLNRNCQQ
jgi:putative CRISPR-associated protein (TIGR02619 family)